MADQSKESRIGLTERWKEIDLQFMRIDAIHIKILDMLMEDCRRKNVEIAKELGLSESSVRARIKHMESMGLISGYSASIDYGVVEKPVKAYVTMKVDNEHRLKVVRRMCQHPRAIAVYGTAGDSDILSVMLFTDAEEFRDFSDRHQKMEGVKSMSIQVVFTAYKGEVWSGA